MKKYKILDIQSVSDIITNSSSEVFIINTNNDSLLELINPLDNDESGAYSYRYLKTEEDVKIFLQELINDDTISDLTEYLTNNPLALLFYDYTIKDFEKMGVNVNKLLDSFMPVYNKLVGKVILEIFDNDWNLPAFVQSIIRISNQNNLIERRQWR